MEVSGQLHAPTALPPVPIQWETGWASETVWVFWTREKSLAHLLNKPNRNMVVTISMYLFIERNY
jgi:hypothetical protein